jgi:hypothetical protein
MAALQQQRQQQQVVTWRQLQGRVLSLNKGSTQIQPKPRSEWEPALPVMQRANAASDCSPAVLAMDRWQPCLSKVQCTLLLWGHEF